MDEKDREETSKQTLLDTFNKLNQRIDSLIGDRKKQHEILETLADEFPEIDEADLTEYIERQIIVHTPENGATSQILRGVFWCAVSIFVIFAIGSSSFSATEIVRQITDQYQMTVYILLSITIVWSGFSLFRGVLRLFSSS